MNLKPYSSLLVSITANEKIVYLFIIVLFAFKQSDNKVIWYEIANGRNSGVYEITTNLITDTTALHKLNNDLITVYLIQIVFILYRKGQHLK